MTYHEINIFTDQASATAKAAEHEAAGRKNVAVTPAPGSESLIIYDNRSSKAKILFDEDGGPFFVVESDG